MRCGAQDGSGSCHTSITCITRLSARIADVKQFCANVHRQPRVIGKIERTPKRARGAASIPRKAFIGAAFCIVAVDVMLPDGSALALLTARESRLLFDAPLPAAALGYAAKASEGSALLPSTARENACGRKRLTLLSLAYNLFMQVTNCTIHYPKYNMETRWPMSSWRPAT